MSPSKPRANRANQPNLRPIADAVRLACAAVFIGNLAAPVAYAQVSTTDPKNTNTSSTKDVTLPAVTVTADTEQERLVTQLRSATVGKSSVSIQDTPFSLSAIEVEQAKEMGAKNVQDALLYSAGVYSGQYGFDTRGDWTAIRGLTPTVYIDGLRSLYGYYNNVRPEIYTLDRIEVLKGPSSALYGQAELGGIINAVSKRPQKTASKEIEVQLGSHDRKQIATDLTGPLTKDGEFLYRLVALKRDSGTQVDFVNDDALVIMPSVTWKPSADTSLTMQYIHQQNDSKVSAQFLPTKGTLEPAPLGPIPTNRFVGEPGWDRYDVQKNELSLFWDQQLSATWKLAASVRKTDSSSVTREHWPTIGAVPDDEGNITRSIHTADRKTDVLASDVRVEGIAKLGPTKHTVAFGIDYQNALWEEFNYTFANAAGTFNLYNPVYGFVDTAALDFSDQDDNKIIQTGVYVMDHMEWGPWVVSGAVRNDRSTNTVLAVDGPDKVVQNTETTGRLGLMYRFANGASPYVSKSTAFVPNLGTDGAGGYLAPTTGEQTEAGVKYLSASGNTSAALAWFDIEQKNRIISGVTPGGAEQVGSTIDGWELEVRHRMGSLEVLANYTTLDAVNDVTKQRLPFVAEKTASAWAQYQFATGWRTGIGSRYVGATVGRGELPVVPSVTLYDAMVGYTTGPWDFMLNIQNAADKEYVSWCRGQGLDCGYGERRNVLLTANYNF
jgi:iron complex outermembrane receptor protein